MQSSDLFLFFIIGYVGTVFLSQYILLLLLYEPKIFFLLKICFYLVKRLTTLNETKYK